MTIDQVWPALTVLGVLLLPGEMLARKVKFYRAQSGPNPNARFETLDGLRGFLAIGVFIHHGVYTWFNQLNGGWDLPLLPVYMLLGDVAVGMFFMITGFLFWNKVLAGEGKLDLTQHFGGRIARLAPMYLLVAITALVITAACVGWPHRTSTAQLARGAAQMMGLGILKWPVFGEFQSKYIAAGVIWTLRFEWMFYILLPVLALCRHRRMFIALVVTYLIWSRCRPGHSLWEPMRPEANLLWGMICAQLMAAVGMRKQLAGRVATIACLIAFAAMPTMLAHHWDLAVFPLSFFVFLCIVNGNSIGGILNLRGAKALGVISYSIYLLHGVFLFLGRPIFGAAARANHVLEFWVEMLVCGVALVLISAVTYRWVEYPVIQWERRHRRKPVAQKQPAPAMEAEEVAVTA